MYASCISFRLAGEEDRCRWKEASRCCGWEAMANFAARRRGVESIVGEDEEMEEGED
jgi:hypothetical protein